MRKMILVVEDDPDLRETLLQFFEGEGHEVRVAADGREALDVLASRGGASLVLLDLRMPEMDGLEFIRSLAGHPQLASAPVVVLTADSKGEGEAQRLGFSRALSKPFSEQALLRLISDYCEPN